MDNESFEEKFDNAIRDAQIKREDAVDEVLMKTDKLIDRAEEMREETKNSIEEAKEKAAESFNDAKNQAQEMGEAAAFSFMIKADNTAAKIEEHHEELQNEFHENVEDFKDTLKFA